MKISRVKALEVCADAAELARAAAEHFLAQAAGAIAARSRLLVALAGGLTPCAAYTLLATGQFASRIELRKTPRCLGEGK